MDANFASNGKGKSMATQREREAFIATLQRECTDKPVDEVLHVARLLLRHAKSHGNIAVAQCNGPGDYVNHIPYPEAEKIYERHEAWCEKREAQLEARMSKLAESIGLRIAFGGDPRGYTVKLFLPSGTYNTWGGKESGYGVPQ